MINIKYVGRSQVVTVPGMGTFTKDKYRLLGREAAQKLAAEQPELFVLKKVKKKIIKEQPNDLL